MAYAEGMSTQRQRDTEFFDAIAAAYALVAASDAQASAVELEGLNRWGAEQGFDPADLEWLAERCRSSVTGLMAPEGAEAHRKLALGRVGRVTDGKRASLVLSAARVAVVADERIDPAEEAALASVARALGLDPDRA